MSIRPLILCSLALPAAAAWPALAHSGEAPATPVFVQKTEVGAHKAGEAVEKAGEKTGEAIKVAGKKTGEALDKAGKKTGEALAKADQHVRKAATATKNKAHEVKQKLDK